MTVKQVGDEYIFKVSVKGLKKSEINSFINYARIRETTAGNKNKSKIKELSKLINKDSLLKYGTE